jgi:hypothetical protein
LWDLLAFTDGRYQSFLTCTCWLLPVKIIRLEMKYYQATSTVGCEASGIMVIDVRACGKSERVVWSGNVRKYFDLDPHMYALDRVYALLLYDKP